jgi:hypothetical protein
MHITIPVQGTLSGKLQDNLKDQLELLQQAQTIITSLGLRLDIKLGEPAIEGLDFAPAFEIPPDAPSPEPTDINEIEEHLEWWDRDRRIGPARRGAREFVLAHLGYFREMEPNLREVIVCYYAPDENDALTLNKTAQLLGVSSSTVNSRLYEALRAAEEKLESLRNAYVSQIAADRAGDEPIAVLNLSISQRQALRKAGLTLVSDVAQSSVAQLRERLQWQEFDERREVKAINDALNKWGLALAG